MTAGVNSSHQVPENWMNDLRPSLIRMATRQLNDVQLAEDAVQETLFAAYRSVEQFRGQGCFSAWVNAILRRKIADSRRSVARIHRIAVAYFNELRFRDTEFRDPSEHIELDETQSVLLNEIEKLPRHQASTMKLMWLEGLSCRAIAEKEGTTCGNVWVRIHRARRHLEAGGL